ncbi:hypothetical protein ACOSP7_015991 [Xanthoceras sorbifolium]
MDQRVDKLKGEVTALGRGQQQILEKITELFDKLNSILQLRAQGRGNDLLKPRQFHHNGSQQFCQPRLIKLEFPHFCGKEDTTRWLYRVEQFFNFHHTPEDECVALASFHLEGDSQLWYQTLKQEKGELQWQDFSDGSVRNYKTQFEKLLLKMGSLSQSHQISCFISGLKDTIKADVLAGHPTSLTSAIGLARLYEVRNTSQHRFTTGGEVKRIDSRTGYIQQYFSTSNSANVNY